MVAQSRVYLTVCKIWPRSGDISFTKIFKKHFVRMYKSTPSSAFWGKNDIFSKFDENSHMGVQYKADEGYYVKN